MKALTVNDLKTLCDEAIAKGLGNRKIVISNDDELNGVHELFYGLSEVGDIFDDRFAPTLPYGITKEIVKKDYIILG